MDSSTDILAETCTGWFVKGTNGGTRVTQRVHQQLERVFGDTKVVYDDVVASK